MIDKSKVIWLYGLSGAGKTTIATALKIDLEKLGIKVVMLDGDLLRAGLNKDLGFTANDREENIRRVAEIAKLLAENAILCICSLITPLETHRTIAQDILGDLLIQVFVDCPLAECEKRDVKGLYARARTNEIKNFTGITAPFEPPKNPDLTVDTQRLTEKETIDSIRLFLKKHNIA
ncbi:adenylyl-sulfate kinase [Sphingobacterium sp. LRF_L2]|uniref:adenylyl-sulfate kinase n=1 Tax=Sphingobacterium sp. LRF_L2 TaxID=3369421 RepID=UPI003F609951